MGAKRPLRLVYYICVHWLVNIQFKYRLYLNVPNRDSPVKYAFRKGGGIFLVLGGGKRHHKDNKKMIICVCFPNYVILRKC